MKSYYIRVSPEHSDGFTHSHVVVDEEKGVTTVKFIEVKTGLARQFTSPAAPFEGITDKGIWYARLKENPYPEWPKVDGILYPIKAWP